MAKKQSFGQKSKKKERTDLVVKVIKSQKKENGSYSFKETLVKVPFDEGIDKVIEETK